VEVLEARTRAALESVRALMVEYAEGVGVDLSYQGFEQELAALPGAYAPPAGQLLLAVDGNEAAGCAGVRPYAPGVCELKRLYVRPRWRGSGLGRTLALAAIDAGRALGYVRMRLDTLPSMGPAIALYRSLGFAEVGYDATSPVPGTLVFEVSLAAVPRERDEAGQGPASSSGGFGG